MAKNLFLDPILVCLALMWTPKKILAGFTSTSSYTLFQAIILYNLKVINEPNWENGKKKLILGLILTRFGPNVVPKNLFVGFTSTRCYALLQAIIVCNFKEN